MQNDFLARQNPRVVHLSFSSTGGAGTVATRLSQIQVERGLNSRVQHLIDGSLYENLLSHPIRAGVAAIDSSLVRKTGFMGPVSALRDKMAAGLSSALREADIVHVHWINGYADLHELAKIAQSKAVVWTLHDMNPFTGTCHYSLGCNRFMDQCNKCPAVNSAFEHLVRSNQRRKREFFSSLESASIVSPSRWLAKVARESSALRGRDIEVIANPLPNSLPKLSTRSRARDQLAIAKEVKTVFLASAAHISDRTKAIHEVIESFSAAFGERSDVLLLIAGRGRGVDQGNVRHLGYLNQTDYIAALEASDYFVVSSLAENQPLAVAEAQAMGVSLIARNTSGLPEMLDIDSNGLLYGGGLSLGKALLEAHEKRISDGDRKELSVIARSKFSPDLISAAYEEVYSSLL